MMKYSLAAALMACSAAAFAPQQQQCARSTTTSSLSDAMPERMWDSMVDKSERSKAIPFLPRAPALDGTMPGDVGFDPFFLSSIPKNFAGFIQPPSWEDTGAGLPTIYWMQEAEIKHCRVAMLAWFGWVATDGGFGFPLRFPADIYSVDAIPNAYNAHDILVNQGSMGFMLLAIGFLEFCSSGAVLVEVSKGESDRLAGDFGLDPLKFLKDATDDEIKRWKTREVANGRLAMLAFGGIATQTALGEAHQGFPYL